MKFYEGKKVLVCGASGLVGSHIIEALLKKNASVRVCIHKTSLSIEDSRLEIVHADLNNPDEARQSVEGMDYVFQASGAVGSSLYSKVSWMKLIQKNLLLNFQILEACWSQKVKRIVLIGSSTGYPNVEHPVKEEEYFLEPLYPSYFGYGWSKRYTEKLAEFVHQNSDTQIAMVRSSAIYGPYDESQHVIPQLIQKALNRQDPFEVWGDGEQKRDFIHARDVAQGCLLALEKEPNFNPINIVAGKSHSLKELITFILKATNHSHAKISYDPSKPTAIPNRAIDGSKAKQLLGFTPQISLEEGINETVQWFQREKKNTMHSSEQKQNFPLISILLPCKNRVSTIRKCMDSILNQDYPNFEILIQDGASTDGTLKILQEYEANYPKIIRLESEKDHYFSEAFQRLICRIKGTLIGACFSDQLYFPNVLQWASQVYQNNPDYAFFGGKLYITDKQWNTTNYFRNSSGNPKDILTSSKGVCLESGFFQKKYLDQIEPKLNLTDPQGYSSDYRIFVQFAARNFPMKHFKNFAIGKTIFEPNHENSLQVNYIPITKSSIKYIRMVFESPYIEPSFREWKGEHNIGILQHLINGFIYIPLQGRAPLDAYEFLLEEIETIFHSIETKKEYKLFKKEIIRLCVHPVFFIAFKKLEKFQSNEIQKIFSFVHHPINQFKIIIKKIYYGIYFRLTKIYYKIIKIYYRIRHF